MWRIGTILVVLGAISFPAVLCRECMHPSSFFGGKFWPNKPYYKYHDKVYYACPGYHHRYTYSTCGSYGDWERASRCYDYCSSHSMEYGYYTPQKDKYSYGEKVKYYCDDGYYLHYYDREYDMAMCGYDGLWNKRKPICKKHVVKCMAHDHKHYYHKKYSKMSNMPGEKMRYECMEGYYKPRGYDYTDSYCQESGKWNKAPYKCMKYCKAPDHRMYYQLPYDKMYYMPDEKMHYRCDHGYYASCEHKYSYSTCKYGGIWNEMPYKCEKRMMKCMPYDHKDYYHDPYMKKSYMPGDKMHYGCMEGYYMPDGYDYVDSYCQNDGTWNRKPYKCMKYCKPEHVKHGSYSPMQEKYKYGEKMYYSCDYGYTKYYAADEYDYNTCKEHGKWEHMAPMCKKYCMAPMIRHGSYIPQMKHYNVDDRLRYTCDYGYKLFYGKDWFEYNICKDTGRWAFEEPTCVRIPHKPGTCYPPHLDYGYYNPKKQYYDYNDKVSYSCMEGYQLYYGKDWFEYSTCQSSGKFDFDPPMCRKKGMNYCGKPHITHGYYKPEMKMYRPGDRVYYECKDGYKLFYDEDWFEYSECKEDGNWDFKAPKCIDMRKKYCSPPDFMHGDYQPKMKMYSASWRMYYKCHDGYQMKYHDDEYYEYASCQDDGLWDYKPPKCMKMQDDYHKDYCDKPYYMHGMRPMKDRYMVGDKVYYECDEGYKMEYYDTSDREYSSCMCGGKWDSMPPKCMPMRNYCYGPDIMHGSYRPKMDKYNPGDYMWYGCDYGYDIYYQGDRYGYAECMSDGRWNQKPPKCKKHGIYYCYPPMIEHGSYEPMMKMYSPYDRLNYKCKDGYKLYYGDDWYAYNECKEDGIWKFKAPECRSVAPSRYCSPPMMEYGSYTPSRSRYRYGQKVSYSCMGGYEIYYDDDYEYMSTCMGGYWDKKAPHCRPKMMKFCHPPDFGYGEYQPQKLKYSHNEHLYYECHDTYRMEYYNDNKYEYNTCIDGKWKYKSPMCQKIATRYCYMKPMAHGYYEPKQAKYNPGDSVSYKCSSGYDMEYHGERYDSSMCMSSGKWDKKMPMCKPVARYCKPYYMKNGDYTPKKNRYSSGDKAYYKCYGGYQMNDKHYTYSKCMNGIWDKYPECVGMQTKYCYITGMSNVDYSPKKPHYKVGERVYFTCHDQYYKHYGGYGRQYSTCNKYGEWDMLPSCVKMTRYRCKAPAYNDYHHNPYAKSYYMPGEYMRYDCGHGYYAPSNMKYKSAKCKDDGTWDNMPYKCHKYCTMKEMKYGYYYPMKQYYKPGDTVTFGCRTSHYISYHNERYDRATCGVNGYWDKKPPMCNRY